MTLLLAVLGTVPAIGVLAAGAVWRRLARRDHRCTVVSRPRSCDACVAVLDGRTRGGHVVCACGAASPHLSGATLLGWRAEHQGEPFPRTSPASPRPVQEGEADPLVVGDAERRAIRQARGRPDPATPQVLREAATALDEADVNKS